MSVDEVVELEVVVVLPEGIDERLRHFEPTDEEDELEDEEERRVEVERLKRGNLVSQITQYGQRLRESRFYS